MTLAILSSCSDNDQALNSKQNDVIGFSKETTFNAVEYREWMNEPENFLIKEKNIAEFNYKVKYLPLEQLVLNDLEKSGKEATAENIAQVQEDYNGMEYFEMRVQVDGFNDELAKYGVAEMSEYQMRISHMAFGLQKNLSLQTEAKSDIPCKLYHFERTYGITPYTTFIFAFSKEDIGNDLERTVVYDDELFNKGRLKFNWTLGKMQLPKLASL